MSQRGIDVALDISRMPALARQCATMPIPGDILEVIEIAAAREETCRRVSEARGVRPEALVLSARFYLQHLLFSGHSDHYRVLGLTGDASRQTARAHMRLLLNWLHPDRNNGLESVYADRVIDAWQSLSSSNATPSISVPAARTVRKTRRASRPPLVDFPRQSRRTSRVTLFRIAGLGLGLVVVTSSLAYYFAPDLYENLAAWKP